MAVVAMFEFPGEDIAKYDQVLANEPGTKDQPKRRFHACYQLPGGGWGVVDVWESQEALDEFVPTLGPAIEKAGLALAPPNIYTVHHTM